MTRKIYVNGDQVKVEEAKITARDLLGKTGRDGDKYKLVLRDGDGGSPLREYKGDDLIDLATCGQAGTTGGPGDGGTVQTPGSAGGPGDGGTVQTPGSAGGPGSTVSATDDDSPCYFTTDYTGSIDPA